MLLFFIQFLNFINLMQTNIKTVIERHLYPDNIFIIGGGPSLKDLDLSPLHNQSYFTIVCNQAYQLIPSATIAHHSDYQWWDSHKDSLEREYKGELVTGCGLGTNLTYPADAVHKLQTINFENKQDFLIDTNLVYGNNCGLQAVSLAHFFMPKNIILIGFDFKARNEQTHGYTPHSALDMQHFEKFWLQFLKNFSQFETLRQNVWGNIHPDQALPHIYNLNPDSALTLYDQSKTLADFL